MNTISLPHAKNPKVIAYVLGSTDSKGRTRPVTPSSVGPCDPNKMKLGIQTSQPASRCQPFVLSWAGSLTNVTEELELHVSDGYAAAVIGDLSRGDCLKMRVRHERMSGGCDLHHIWCATQAEK